MMIWNTLDGLVRNQSVVSLLVLVLACWRLTSLLVQEEGPFKMFARFRRFVGVRYVSGSPVPYGTNVIAELISCIWCCSVWVGAGLSLAYIIEPELTVLAALPFALSAGAIIVGRILNG